MEIFGVLCSGSLKPQYGNLYVNIVILSSVFVAMYCLVALYDNTRLPLAEHKPLLKFLSVKFIIFFSFLARNYNSRIR